MISSQNVACTATFMAVGMHEGDRKNKSYLYNDLIGCWGKGCIEMHLELAQYAVLTEKAVAFIQMQAFDFPGVYDYEVSEPFGVWFGEYIWTHSGEAPPVKAATEHLIESTCRFFNDEPFEAGKLFAQVMEHLKNGN